MGGTRLLVVRASEAVGAVTFFFTAPPPAELYTLSLHDALPISPLDDRLHVARLVSPKALGHAREDLLRSEEHTSELQSRLQLVCRLLLEKQTIPPATTVMAEADVAISFLVLTVAACLRPMDRTY